VRARRSVRHQVAAGVFDAAAQLRLSGTIEIKKTLRRLFLFPNKKAAHFRGRLLRTAEKQIDYLILVSLYITCLRALGSNFMISIFAGIVRLFLSVV
jgi:hypothetical protein